MTAPVRPGPSRRALFAFAPLVGGALAWNAARGTLFGWAAPAELAAGLLLWTLLEYVFHRYLFHIVPTAPWLLERQQHLRHHATPQERAYYVVPLGITVPLAGIVWGLLRVALGSWPAAALATAGVMTGYVAYELIHYRVHQGAGRNRIVRFWRRHHLYHHYADDQRCFGFTTPLWDWVFGTAPPRVRRRVRPGRAL
jgi:sterol desaturase/sphingolipid hydroxylase (fatty acid hydroxylase superfamily)